MEVHVDLNCVTCGESVTVHETGLNEYDVYPCDKCYPDNLLKEDD